MQQKVPSTALSSFCTECGNRINLQNYEIRGRYRGNLDTKGVIYISSDGFVEGNINTGTVILAGKFKGEIVAEEKVSLKTTAKLYGKVMAPALTADCGAVFVGHLHIGKKSDTKESMV
jgi:cytoskeletal protein CcmA (bactofilin family)